MKRPKDVFRCDEELGRKLRECRPTVIVVTRWKELRRTLGPRPTGRVRPPK